eukprot:gnl/Trimastix_PCT/3964.p1 GENE.gnl/Trimastix_PCT/3964~~gnl/Trimastix_PCT/3964.p1  ORF type:complete len:473 (+),score=131.59 gnl/Trimastix_PCT/3964:39-1457(+)
MGSGSAFDLGSPAQFGATSNEHSLNGDATSVVDESKSLLALESQSPSLVEGLVTPATQPPPEKKGASTFGAIFNLANSMIGAGTLTFPFAFRNCGIVFGFILAMCIYSLAFTTLYWVIRSSLIVKKSTYKEITIHALGKVWGYVIEIAVVIYSFGILCSYVVIIGRYIPQCFDAWLALGSPARGFLCNKHLVSLCIVVVIILPLTFLRRLDMLRFTSLAALACIGYAVVVVFIRAVGAFTGAHKPYHSPTAHFSYFPDTFMNVFLAMPLLMFAFSAHINVMRVFQELPVQKQKARAIPIIGAALTICAILYFLMATFGYLTFWSDTPDNILSGYPNNDYLTMTGKIMMSFTIIFSFPLISFTTRKSFECVVFPNRDFSWPRHILEGTLITACAYGVGTNAPNLSSVFGFIGATCGAMISYIFPGLFIIRLNPGKFLRRPVHWLGFGLVAFGFVAGSLSLAKNIMHIADPKHY